MTDQIKPVRAWAVVDEMGTFPTDEFPHDKDCARLEADVLRRLFGGEYYVIPVTITYGHGGEDE